MPRARTGSIMRVLMVLWPSFVMAGVLETLVFVVVDPGSLAWFGDVPIDLPARAVYTLGFFVFWAVIAAAGALTTLLSSGSDPSR